MRIHRKQIYSALAGAGIILGAAGLASAATGSSPPQVDPTIQAPATVANPDDADGGVESDETSEGPEQDEANEPADGQGGHEDGDSTENDGGDDIAYTSSVTVADGGESGSEVDEQGQLAGLASITADDAAQAALAAQPGAVSDVQLENENGNVVYSVMVDTGNGSVDVKIDAGDGSVLTTETDDGDQHAGADESNEAPGAEVADD